MEPTCTAAQEALLRFAQSCFMSEPKTATDDDSRAWLFDFLEDAQQLTAADVARWPTRTQAALRELIEAMISALEMRRHARGDFLLPEGTLDATTPQQLGKGLLIGLASRRASTPR
jgi:hypothetical protein